MAVTLNANTSTGLVATADLSGAMAFQTSGTTAVTIDSSQKVGIGTTTPSTSLQVNGTVTATSFNSTSDYRIKQNVTELSTTDTVDTLRPVRYLNTESKKNDIGLIAHEVQHVYPEIVSGEYNGETNQSLNYSGLIPVLINEIKMLKARVTELEHKLGN